MQMVEERIQTLLNTIKDQCPNIGPVPCFMDEKHAILLIHFRYDSEPIQENEEDDDPLNHGYKHMFQHAVDLQESDWSAHEKHIVDRYNSCMEKQLNESKN